MPGILVIAHRPLASALLEAAGHVYSRDPCCTPSQMEALDVEPDADPARLAERARELVRALDAGQGVLVLTDVFGSTPGNLAASLACPGRVAVVAGASLPMLLRAVCYHQAGLVELAEKAVAGGTQGVVQVVPTPVQNQNQRNQVHDLARLHDQQ